MKSERADKIAIVLWSLVLVLAFVSLSLLAFDSVARAATRIRNHSGEPVILLNEKQTISIRGPVTQSAMVTLSAELLAKSARLHPRAKIYLVLDTPGGDVDAGNMFLDVADGIPQRVDTITVFSASMGFHIAQRLGQRLVLKNGKFMSHRLRIGGLSGQVPGEADSRLKEIRDLAERMDLLVAKRMGLDFAKYREMIRDEYWVTGQKAVDENAADKVVVARCGESLQGDTTISVDTLFGTHTSTVSKCPLISGTK